MSTPLSVSCPGCQRTLRGKPDLIGKTIRCPECEEMFIFQPAQPVEEVREDDLLGGKPAEGAAAKDRVTAAPPVVQVASSGGDAVNYGVVDIDLTPRCPNCANPLESEDSVVCLYCGYNTMTRQWGRTAKLVEYSTSDWIQHLLPGFLALAFIFFDVVGLLYLCLVLPSSIDRESWMAFLDSEPIRLWSTIINLFLLWAAAYFCYQRFIVHPTPPEKEKK
jgi:hypothetical protein